MYEMEDRMKFKFFLMLSRIPKYLKHLNLFGWLSRVNPFCPKGKMDGLL
jgi:hypothetical protein